MYTQAPIDGLPRFTTNKDLANEFQYLEQLEDNFNSTTNELSDLINEFLDSSTPTLSQHLSYYVEDLYEDDEREMAWERLSSDCRNIAHTYPELPLVWE